MSEFMAADIKMDFGPLWKYLATVEEALREPFNGALAPTFRLWGEIYRSFIQKRFIDYSRGGGDWPPLKLRSILGRKRNKALRKRVRNPKVKKVEVNYGKLTVTHLINGRISRSKSKPKGNSKGRARRVTFTQAKKKLKAAFKAVKRKWKNKGKDSSKVKTKQAILTDTGVLRNSLAPTIRPSAGAYQRNMNMAIAIGWSGGSHEGGVTVEQLMLWHHNGVGRLPKRTILALPDTKTVDQLVSALSRGIRRLEQLG